MEPLRRVGLDKFLNLSTGLAEGVELPDSTLEEVIRLEDELNHLIRRGNLAFRELNGFGVYVASTYRTIGFAYVDKNGKNYNAMYPMFRGIIFSLNPTVNSKMQIQFGQTETTDVLPLGGFKGIFFE